MAFRDGPFENLKVPLIWTAGLTVLVVLVVSVFLLLSQRRGDPDSQNAIRGAGDQVSGGVGGVLAAPVRWAPVSGFGNRPRSASTRPAT